MDSGVQVEIAKMLTDARERVADEKSFVDFMGQLSVDWYVEKEIEAVAPSSPYPGGLCRVLPPFMDRLLATMAAPAQG